MHAWLPPQSGTRVCLTLSQCLQSPVSLWIVLAPFPFVTHDNCRAPSSVFVTRDGRPITSLYPSRRKCSKREHRAAVITYAPHVCCNGRMRVFSVSSSTLWGCWHGRGFVVQRVCCQQSDVAAFVTDGSLRLPTNVSTMDAGFQVVHCTTQLTQTWHWHFFILLGQGIAKHTILLLKVESQISALHQSSSLYGSDSVLWQKQEKTMIDCLFMLTVLLCVCPLWFQIASPHWELKCYIRICNQLICCIFSQANLFLCFKAGSRRSSFIYIYLCKTCEKTFHFKLT